jgi:hypothetical protein
MHQQLTSILLVDSPKDIDDLINKPIENYVHMKIIYIGRVPAAPVSPSVIHHALSHLMDHNAHANMHLVMPSWGSITSKEPGIFLIVVVFVLVLMMNTTSMMYILGTDTKSVYFTRWYL